MRGFLGREVIAYGVLSVVNNSNPIDEHHKNIAKLLFGPAIAKSNDLWVSEGLLLHSDKVESQCVWKIDVEIRHIVVDSLENGIVKL